MKPHSNNCSPGNCTPQVFQHQVVAEFNGCGNLYKTFAPPSNCTKDDKTYVCNPAFLAKICDAGSENSITTKDWIEPPHQMSSDTHMLV